MLCRRGRRSRFSLPLAVPSVIERSVHKCVNQYVRLSLVGRGASAKVYAARDRHDGQLYALKQFRFHRSSDLSALESEIAVLQSLAHPNIIALHEVLRVPESGTIFLVTDFADCGSLEAVLQLHGALPPATVRSIFAQAAAGVAYLHSLRIVHQDLKPGNLLLTRAGDVWITDFGLSHAFDAGASAFGTPLYQAPEVLAAAGECDRGKEDVWSLGVTLYEMVFGDVPFRGADLYAIVAAINRARLAPPRDCDPEAWRVIRGMLAVDPRERWAIADVLASEFVRGAPPRAEFARFHHTVIEAVEDGAPMVEIQALQCPPGYRFLFDDAGRQKGRGHSYPD
jgi:serine/threonine protein kinase